MTIVVPPRGTRSGARSPRLSGASDGASSATRFELALVFLVPVLAALGPLAPLAGPIFAFRAAVVLLFVTALFGGRRAKSISSPLRTSTWWLLIIGTVSAVALTMIYGLGDYGGSELVSIAFGALLVVSFMLLPVDRTLIRTLIFGWLGAFVVTAGLALFEIRTGWRASNHFSNRDPQGLLTDDGAASSFGNPNDYAHFLLMAGLLFVIGFSVTHKPISRVVLTLAALSVPLFVVATESILGVVLAAILALGLLLAKVPLASPVLIILLGVAALIVATFPGGLPALLGVDPIYVALFDEGRTGAVRANLLINGWRFSVESGLFGFGPGGFETRMAAGNPDDLTTFGILSPHSAITETLSQYGVASLIALVITMVILAKIGWRAYRSSHVAGSVKFAGLAILMYVLLSPLVTIMGSSNLEPSYTWAIFASLLLIGRWLEEMLDSPETASAVG